MGWRSRPPDTLAPFVNLTNDEERELKATSASIGRYFAIFTPRSFAHLPEYRQWQEPRGENQSSFNQRRQYVPRHFARGPHEHEAERRNADPDVVFIERFEPPVNQAPALLQTLSEAEPPDLTHASSDPPQNSYMEHHTSIQRRMYDCGPQRIVHSGHYNPRHNSEPSKLRPNLHVSATSSYYGQYYPTAPATAPLRDESFIGFPTSSVPVRTGLSARSGSLLEEMVGMHNPDQDHSSR
ncbi:MAG: hypothetical protein M1828_000048 [Chrysothrix sp. TS-e1954]|nr:MAG: hypothetical protein M1828_000048 [Chrysothrix sp. TS-e1954]